jgi:hypothetical protein
LYNRDDLPRVQVGFRMDQQLYNDFTTLAKQLHMTANEAHVEAIKHFVFAKGTNIIKKNIELERKNLDALEAIFLQNEESQIILQETHKQTISFEIQKEIDNYVLRMDRSFHSHHVIEYASTIANKNKLDLKEILILLKDTALAKFPGDPSSNRRLVTIENAIMAVDV